SGLTGQGKRIARDVDNSSVPAASDDHQSAIPDIDDERLVVEHQRIRFPVVVSPGILHRETRFVTGGTVNLAGDQHRIIEQKTGLTFFNNIEASALQRRATGGRDFHRVSTRDTNAPAIPEIGMDQHRHAELADATDQSIETGRVIEVAM